ncbi:Formyl-CoA:oxalate CoA-transferase [subsurface metagenome]
MKKPLEGIRVLDLGHVLAMPTCTMQLADLGAEVIKIEKPGIGDDSRYFVPFINNESAYFISINRNKKSITLDLKKEKARKYSRIWLRFPMWLLRTIAPILCRNWV